MVLSSLVNRPNRVYEKQRLVQLSKESITYALPRSRLYVRSYHALFAVGMCGCVYSAYHLIKGKSS
ncbi:hypothetical protein EW026_g5855 [Hermanssonia centrifuga]|uniref:Uncharacterized protein n=1 Tax=Hermanssonia centrifuga TaxID=98765 RepID=A0A4S4KCT4_9APHY|nr:hypothetical protein EW026_g5855 [Hermanssonia centrifuga]